MDRPKLSTCMWLSILSVIWMSAGVLIYIELPDEWLINLALVLIQIILVVSAGVQWVYYLWYQHSILETYARQAAAITPLTEAASAIARLSPEQLEFLGANGYYATIGIAATESGPAKVFLTPFGNMPWEAAVKELRSSTYLGLRAIRETSDGSPERAWRKMFTEYCIYLGLAMRAEGKYSARWTDKTSRETMAGRMGVALYQDATDEEDE